MSTAQVGTGLDAGHPREILRQASVALGGATVTLWEEDGKGGVTLALASTTQPRHTATALDVDGTLRRWGVSATRGARWLGCRIGEGGRWYLAPVRRQPAAPPPDGVERRAAPRMTLELAGLCVGVLDPARAVFARRPEPDALVELARHPSAIAHEVANPLTAALANLDECLETVRHEEARDERSEGLLRNLSGVEEGLQQAVGFLRSIQNRARDAFALEERFDAVRVVNSCVALERPLARKSGSSLTVYSMPEPVFLRGDPNGLYRILTNLVRNAVHASAGHDDGVSVALERAHGSLQLVVRDRGAGIAPELLERIFEPGFTTKSIGAGSGMGLAIAKEIAEQVFGGTIRVESAVGQGSVFTVILPLPPQRTSPPG